LRDPVEQEHYLKRIAKVTDTSLEAVHAKFLNQPKPQTLFRKSKVDAGYIDVIAVEHQRLQDHFLAMMLMQPKLRWLLKGVKSDYFTDGPQRTVLEFVQANPQFDGDPKVAAQLQEVGDYVKIISLQFEELYASLAFADLQEQATNLKHRLLDRYVKIEKEKLAAQMRSAQNDKEIRTLVKEADKLNLLIKSWTIIK